MQPSIHMSTASRHQLKNIWDWIPPPVLPPQGETVLVSLPRDDVELVKGGPFRLQLTQIHTR